MDSTPNRREVLRVLGIGGLVSAGLGSLTAMPRRLFAGRGGEPSEQAGSAGLELDASQPTTGDAAHTTAAAKPLPVIDEIDQPLVAGLLAPVAPGTVLADATVVSIRGVRLGAASVLLQGAGGTRYQIDICRRDPALGAPEAVATTSRYDLFVANGGKGSKRTDQKPGLAARALAEVIRANEQRVPALAVLSLRQREQRFPGGAFSIAGA